MKKVLIVAHLLHATPRIPAIARYLPEFGWEPVILTASLPEKPKAPPFQIIETPYRETLGFLKKLLGISPREDPRLQLKRRFGVAAKKSPLDFILTRIGEVVNYPDGDKGWKSFAIKAGEEFLQWENAAAIVSSSSPVTSHLIAKALKRHYKIPWVADLRDLWSQNHNYSYSSLRRCIDRRLELKTLAEADALVTVSKPWTDDLKSLHRRETVYTVTNGFDPETVSRGGELTRKFTITYTGLIYTGKQEPSRLFTALRDLIAEKKVDPADIEVRFYGPEMSWLPGEVEKYGLSAIIGFHGIVLRDVSLQKQAESQILLLLNWEDLRVRGWHPLKSFEYLAARRPILAIGGSGADVTKTLLDETRAGIYCRTVEDIKNALMALYTEYKRTGKANYTGDIKEISKYSYREMAREFSNVLNNVTGG